MGEITGSRLSFDADDPAQGIFFVAEADGTTTRADVVAQNAPSRLLFQVPKALAAGDYRVEIRAVFGDETRTGRLDAVLTAV